MAGKNFGVYRRRPDSLRHVRRRMPITIETPVLAVSPALRLFRFNVSKPRHRTVRQLRLPITITAPPEVAGVLRHTSEVFRNRAVFRREFDYYIRFTKRIKPITISAPDVPVPDYKFVINPITGQLDRVVNNMAVLKADKDETDPTSGGGDATGRIPITINGATVYIPYY